LATLFRGKYRLVLLLSQARRQVVLDRTVLVGRLAERDAVPSLGLVDGAHVLAAAIASVASKKVESGDVGLTVRLKPEIVAALKRASLERQLAGEEIYAQQNLLKQALEPWLKGE
jgi:hypothetical protein